MKIACVLGPKFEDSEFKEPYDAFRQAGHEVTVVGLEAGGELYGDKGKVKAKVVVDRNLVTSRQPSDIPAFVRESLKVLEQVPARR